MSAFQAMALENCLNGGCTYLYLMPPTPPLAILLLLSLGSVDPFRPKFVRPCEFVYASFLILRFLHLYTIICTDLAGYCWKLFGNCLEQFPIV